MGQKREDRREKGGLSEEASDPFSRFDREDPLAKYGSRNGPEKEEPTARKTKDFLDKGGSQEKQGNSLRLGGGGGLPGSVDSRNLLEEKEASDFDDLDFEEKEKEAGVRNNTIGRGTEARNKPVAQREEKEPEAPEAGGDLDFDDLEF